MVQAACAAAAHPCRSGASCGTSLRGGVHCVHVNAAGWGLVLLPQDGGYPPPQTVIAADGRADSQFSTLHSAAHRARAISDLLSLFVSTFKNPFWLISR